MNKHRVTRTLLVASLAGLGLVAGCNSSKTQRRVAAPPSQPQVSMGGTASSSYRGSTQTPSTGRPMTSGGTASGSMPSGSRQAANTPRGGMDSMSSSNRAGSTRGGAGWPSNRSRGDVNWSAMAYPTGDVRSSTIGIEKALPHEVRLNQPFDYELVITNLTDNTLTDVEVSDIIGESFEIAQSTPQGRAGSGGLHTWDLGRLDPGEAKKIKVRGKATSEGEIGCCTSVSYASMFCAKTPVVAPALRIVQSGPAEVLKCDVFEYRIDVSNPGSGMLENVRVNETLPAGLVTVNGKREISIDVGTLKGGQTRSFTAKLEAERTGTFSSTARASGKGVESVSSQTVSTIVRQPVLTITKSCPSKQFAGRPLDYTITIANTGDGVARDTVVRDRLPSNATLVSASDGGRSARGGQIVWSVGTLQPKATRTFNVQIKPESVGTISGEATIEAACATAASDSCQTQITGIPAILLEVVDVEDPTPVGQNETYLITVTNQGSADGTNIQIVCTLEANQQLVSASGATRGAGRGQTVTFEPLGRLGAKEKATFRVVVKNLKAGDTRFKVSMNSDQLTRPVEETEATNIYE